MKPAIVTIPELAAILGQPQFRVRYVVEVVLKLRPLRLAGHVKLFDEKILPRVRDECDRIVAGSPVPA